MIEQLSEKSHADIGVSSEAQKKIQFNYSLEGKKKQWLDF